MRRAAKVDSGQAAIVAALRAAGCSVLSLAAVGKGCPDLLVAKNGRTWLLEVKQPLGPLGGKAGNGQHLNPDQIAFGLAWAGELWVVRTPEDALESLHYWQGHKPPHGARLFINDHVLRAVEAKP